MFLCIYYGNIDNHILSWLRGCRLAVLPPTLDSSVLHALREAGTVPLAYISVTTVGGWEPWARLVNSSILVGGEETKWGEKVVNPCSAAWRRILLDAVNRLLDRGYRGIFLDNLDMVDRYPWMKPCVASLVAEVKTRHPGAVVMVNRGFSILDRVAGSIDYLLFEDFATYYDPATRRYHVFTASDLEWEKKTLSKAVKLGKEKGFTVLLLAYAPPGDQKLLSRICREWRSWGHGLPLYVAPGLLDKPGLCNPCTPTGG